MTDAGVTVQQQLQDFANIRGIDRFEEKETIATGWQGKAKGLLQVLWERGLIPEQSLEKYTNDGRKDPITGTIDLRFSLRHILGECTDFKEEETALQYLGTQIGVTVQLTPKFHAELAGEGIEYCWAHAKAYYCREPLSRKRGRENFKELVKECTSVKVLTKNRIEKFASRARAYICAYHFLDSEQQAQGAQASVSAASADPMLPNHQLLYNKIQSVMKEFKCHRSVLDFDRGFINAALKKDAVS